MKVIEGWIRIQLGKVVSLIKGISYTSENYCNQGEGAIFVTIKCISKSGGFKNEGIKYFKGVIEQKQILLPGDLLIGNTDLTRDGDIIGCPLIIPDISEKTTITMSMDLSKLIEDNEKIDRKFLYYKLMAEKVRKFMKEHSSGSTVLHLQTRAVPTLEMEIPNLKSEQYKIAEILSTVDRAIEQTEALIAKQQRIKTGLMQDLLTRGIDEQGNIRSEQTHKFKDSPVGRIPVEWESELLRTRVSIQGGYAFPSKDYVKEGIQVIRIGNLFHNKLSLDRDPVFLNEKYRHDNMNFILKQGDIIMSMTGTVGKRDYGYAVEIDVEDELLLNQRVCKFILGLNISKEYLLCILHGEGYLSKLYDSAGGTKQANLNSSDILNIIVSFPPLGEQELIADVIKTENQKIDVELSSLRKLQYLKTALMQDLLTGKKRVTPLL